MRLEISKRAHAAARLLFVVLALVTYTHTAGAVDLGYQVNCNSFCTGGTRVHECEYYEVNSAWNWCGWVEGSVYDRMYGWCDSQASGAGQHGLAWFAQFSCLGGDNWQGYFGFFECSYLDSACPG